MISAGIVYFVAVQMREHGPSDDRITRFYVSFDNTALNVRAYVPCAVLVDGQFASRTDRYANRGGPEFNDFDGRILLGCFAQDDLTRPACTLDGLSVGVRRLLPVT
jgi:hypothetical protein